LKEADKYAQAWLKDATSIPADLAPVAVELASRRAGPDRLDALLGAAKGAKHPQDRVTALRAMGGFGDPALLKRALDGILGDAIKPGEARHLIAAAAAHRTGRSVLADWSRESWDKARAKLGDDMKRLLPLPAQACSAKAVADTRELFTPRLKELVALQRPFEVSMQQAAACAALRAHGGKTAAEWLAKKR
jgi:cytosol alanyl aminopeptidase